MAQAMQESSQAHASNMETKHVVTGAVTKSNGIKTTDPGNPARKTWWTKEVMLDNYYTAGRLTERQIKYAAEDGFNSVVSLLFYAADDMDDSGGHTLPSTGIAEHTAVDVCGIQFATVLDEGNSEWKTVETVLKLGALIQDLPKPILVYSDYAYAATFTLLAHLAAQTYRQKNISGDLIVSPKHVFEIGTYMGFSFGDDPELVDIIASITGDHVSDPPTYPGGIPDWYTKFWMFKPVYGHWYVSGQIQKDHLENIKALELGSWLTSRKGKCTPPDNPSQEEVPLLNIDDAIDTYASGGRQKQISLKEHRIIPSKPAQYISKNSTINYETTNEQEFGDDIGYNEDIQRAAMEQHLPNVKYYHLPIGGEYYYTSEMWETFKDSVIEANSKGPLVLQCRTAYISSALALLAVGQINGFSFTWAQNRARQMGYRHEQAVVDLWQKELNDDTPNSASSPTS